MINWSSSPATSKSAFEACRITIEAFRRSPGVSGPQLAAHLVQVYPAWKVLFMSGYAAEEMDRHGVDGVDIPLLPKPFKPAELTDRIRGLLDDRTG